jgi:hypothetical protein
MLMSMETSSAGTQLVSDKLSRDEMSRNPWETWGFSFV